MISLFIRMSLNLLQVKHSAVSADELVAQLHF